MAAKKDYLFHPDRNPLLRDDYRAPEYKIPEANVRITLDEMKTVVHSRIWVKRNPDMPDVGGPLVLDGEDIALKSLQIVENGKLRHLDPQEYVVTDKHLILKRPPDHPFALEIVTEICPTENTKLSGIYMAGDILCSQCEAQGFRRISYFLDRPDNLTKFTVSLAADEKKFPILLSNGNGDYAATHKHNNGTHSITWNDPWPKPSYLFAVVAGDMKVLEDKFTTMSGRDVALRIFVQPGYEDKITWAMESIKRSMKWDEERYGREYDLDCFHVVAVDKFNAGAMENKGLNVFNVSYLVGSPETSTDAELTAIEAVIGHEYFHNWTGDRVTVRDWFELTLKEGLTVLRDRQFTSDMHSEKIQTIDDANELRIGQFMEDSGPMAHPIRPDRVEEFNNIYSGTIYTKGSHVLGMLHTMMGETTWRASMDTYFDRFDGQAVTCDDFVNVMEEVSGLDLTQFRRWYSQSGTPEISYSGKYDDAAKTYTLTLTQNTPPTADQKDKQPLHIPVAVGLISESGNDALPEKTRILHLTQATQDFIFENVSGPVVPSVLRGFSAPVKITTQPTDDELLFRMQHDSDAFNKYEATERFMLKTIHRLIEDYQNGEDLHLGQSFLFAYADNLALALDGDLAFSARILQLPAYSLIVQDQKVVDPDAVNAVLHFMRRTLAEEFHEDFKHLFKETIAPAGEAYNVVPEQVGRRELHNLCLGFLGKLETPANIDITLAQYHASRNMTEKLAALSVLSRMTSDESKMSAEQALADFYTQYKDNNTLIDKWLQLQAAIPHGDVLGRVKSMMEHEAYDKTNPNKVRALIGGFLGGNPTIFHSKDGSGYAFLANVIIEMNDINPHVAAGLAGRLGQFKRYDNERQALMIEQMQRIMETPNLDSGLREILGKALGTAPPKTSAVAQFKNTAKK